MECDDALNCSSLYSNESTILSIGQLIIPELGEFVSSTKFHENYFQSRLNIFFALHVRLDKHNFTVVVLLLLTVPLIHSIVNTEHVGVVHSNVLNLLGTGKTAYEIFVRICNETSIEVDPTLTRHNCQELSNFLHFSVK